MRRELLHPEKRFLTCHSFMKSIRRMFDIKPTLPLPLRSSAIFPPFFKKNKEKVGGLADLVDVQRLVRDEAKLIIDLLIFYLIAKVIQLEPLRQYMKPTFGLVVFYRSIFDIIHSGPLSRQCRRRSPFPSTI